MRSNLLKLIELSLPFAYVAAIVSVAIAFWIDLLGKNFGVSVWTVVPPILTSVGTVVALGVVGYNLWKDQKSEAEKFERVHEFVNAFCDEMVAELSPFTRNRSHDEGVQIIELPAIIDAALAEKMYWDNCLYFAYPTNFNFRYVLSSVRNMTKMHSRMIAELSKNGPAAFSKAVAIRQSNLIILDLIERAIVSAEITKFLDVTATVSADRGHLLDQSLLTIIEKRNNISEARIREISKELRCTIQGN